MSAEGSKWRDATESLLSNGRTGLQQLIKRAAIPLLLLLFPPSEIRGQCVRDVFDPNPNSVVEVVIVQPDGKVLIGGDFTKVLGVGRNHIARLNPDGTLDRAFDPKANEVVYSLAMEADGKILAGGNFTSMGGESRNHIARLQNDDRGM
jgi:Domain of unknown function (DUF5122) beta-propeller